MFVHRGRPLREMILLTFACLAWGGCQQTTPEESAENSLPGTPVPVRAVQAEMTTLRPSVDLIGMLVALPESTTTVSPQVGGWVQKVLVVEGAKVQAGDELVLLDTRLAEVAVARAQASVAEKEATLARLQRGYLPQELEIAQYEVEKCRETAAALQAETQALEPLRQNKEISDLQVQKLASSLRAAEAGQAAAEARLRLLQAGTPREEIAEAESRVTLDRTDLAAAKLNLELCRIVSPTAGTVTQLQARQGTFVERSTSLMTITDLSRVFLQVRVPSVHMAQLQVGAQVDIGITSAPDSGLQGEVARISSQADPATGDVDAFVLVSNGRGTLRPGLACRGRVWLPELANVLSVPIAAVADRAGTPVVTVVRDNLAHETEVTLGMQTLDRVQVTKGLSAGDWVITEGGYDLPDDCPVQVVSEPALMPMPKKS
ncbi:MAG: efflux RND transporter periplasmic adaptor subunit [Pirellulaceae bacterium]